MGHVYGYSAYRFRKTGEKRKVNTSNILKPMYTGKKYGELTEKRTVTADDFLTAILNMA